MRYNWRLKGMSWRRKTRRKRASLVAAEMGWLGNCTLKKIKLSTCIFTGLYVDVNLQAMLFKALHMPGAKF